MWHRSFYKQVEWKFFLIRKAQTSDKNYKITTIVRGSAEARFNYAKVSNWEKANEGKGKE